MTLKGTIEIVDEGTSREAIFVRYESIDSSTPTARTFWWLVHRVVRDPYSPTAPKTGDVVYSSGDSWRGRGFSVFFPGGQPAARIEKRAIPCPKVRAGVETRWNTIESRWEKLLKRGWVAA